jgi:hypothetical protein
MTAAIASSLTLGSAARMASSSMRSFCATKTE